jgi:inosine-uridine nucleoside N-ribohydrolase
MNRAEHRPATGSRWRKLIARILFLGTLTLIGLIALSGCGQDEDLGSISESITAVPLNPDARQVIVDTDMAPDDWMAILYMLRRPDVEVKAITVTGTGETHCDPGIQNVHNLAALAGRPAIPVACGPEKPIEGKRTFPEPWRRFADDMAGLSLSSNPQPESSQRASQLLAETIRASEEPVSILTLGPLTNLAQAFQEEPALADEIATITIMGGAFDVDGNVGLSGVGIDNQAAEWNIYIDPQASNLVLASGAPVTFVPLDATNQAPVTLAFYERLAENRETPAAEFVYQQLTKQRDQIANEGYFFWDPLAAVISTNEEVATFAEMPVRVVEEEGPESGATRVSEGSPMARVAVDADRQQFEAIFLETINRPRP